MAFRVWKDLLGGGKPATIEVPYNGSLDADNVTVRYKGSFVKLMDFDNVDNGQFYTFAGLTTAMEDFVGILEEHDDGTGNYLPNDGTYGMKLRKITPCFPSTVILGEYARADAAGSAMTDTGATCSAGSATFTIDTDTADSLIGAWIYMLTGSEAGRLHHVIDSAANASATFDTVATKAIASADTFLVVAPAATRDLLFNDTFTGIKSEVAADLWVHNVVGIMNWIEDIGIPFQPLDVNKHEMLILKNPKFYHSFVIGNLNAWSNGRALS